MELIEKYFTDLSQIQKQQFKALGDLYTEWNNKINLISRKDIQHLYLHHILHSLAIAKYIRFKPGTLILDVGTGGGFPGIPLAIMFPQSRFVLIDSIAKKIKVVESVSKSLELKNCTAKQIRAEELNGKFDFVVSRAVAPLPLFITWVKNLILKQSAYGAEKGILYLKGGDLTEEPEMQFKSRVIQISDFYQEPFFETKKIVHVLMP
jgi:16S rRNA (guanine527-N7)-methyltransferase